MDTAHIQLVTLLTPEQCVSRLTNAIDTERSSLFSTAALLGSKPVIGSITESTLSLRKRIGYRNTYQSHLSASLLPMAGGTVISGKFALHPFVRVFMFVWFGGVIILGGAVFVIAIRSLLTGPENQQENAWLGIVIPPSLLAFGLALRWVGRLFARNEARFLTDFLVQTLDAKAQ